VGVLIEPNIKVSCKNAKSMSSKLFVSRFFDLDHYEHSALFDRADPLWSALELLEEHLRSFPHLGQLNGTISPQAYLEQPETIYIAPGCQIEAGAFIRGPCILGEGCVVRAHAYIRGFLVAGRGCLIGHGTEVKNSILLNDVHLAHFNYLGDSILGNGVNLGAGAKCANFRLDGGMVQLRIDGQKVNSGMRKLGAILGDGVQVGCNAVLSPGTVLGARSTVEPTLHVVGVYGEGARLTAKGGR